MKYKLNLKLEEMIDAGIQNLFEGPLDENYQSILEQEKDILKTVPGFDSFLLMLCESNVNLVGRKTDFPFITYLLGLSEDRPLIETGIKYSSSLNNKKRIA